MNKLTLSLSAIALSLATSISHAGGVSPFYLGATIGQTSHETEGCGTTGNVVGSGGAVLGTATKTCEDHDTAYQAYGGFHFSEALSVEAGYADLGATIDAKNALSVPGSGNPTLQNKQETSTIFAAGVARMAVSKASPLSVYGKAGVHRWTSELEREGLSSSGVISATAKSSGFSPLVGAGIEYDVTNGATLRAGWDRFYDVGDKDDGTVEKDVDVMSAGLNYYFL